MNIRENLVLEVLSRLSEARSAMRKLMSVSDDWSAKMQVDEEFDNLEDAVLDFAKHQIGITFDKKPKN